MDDKIITLATLTFEKAQLVKTLLENEGVDCFLEHINLIQGSISSGVKINIRELDFEQAMMIFDSIRESDFEKNKKTSEDDLNFKILVPVDFSEYSTKAIDFAFDWVRKFNGEICLFNSFFSPINTGFPFNDSYVYDINAEELGISLKEEAETKMNRLKENLDLKVKDSDIKDVIINTEIRRGVAEHEIINFSEEYKPSLIVMGTRGADKKVVDLIGSVTAEIIELAKRPVMAIPESFVFKNLTDIKKVAYLTIFSDQDFYAIERLAYIVEPLNVEIICGHITNDSELEKDKVKQDGLIEHFRKLNIKTKIEFKLVKNDDFLVGVESFVQQNQIDILSFTTYKRSLITKLLNPSIAKKMLFHSTTPLLVFHA